MTYIPLDSKSFNLDEINFNKIKMSLKQSEFT